MRRRIEIDPSSGHLDDQTLQPYLWDEEPGDRDFVVRDDAAWQRYQEALIASTMREMLCWRAQRESP